MSRRTHAPCTRRRQSRTASRRSRTASRRSRTARRSHRESPKSHREEVAPRVAEVAPRALLVAPALLLLKEDLPDAVGALESVQSAPGLADDALRALLVLAFLGCRTRRRAAKSTCRRSSWSRIHSCPSRAPRRRCCTARTRSRSRRGFASDRFFFVEVADGNPPESGQSLTQDGRRGRDLALWIPSGSKDHVESSGTVINRRNKGANSDTSFSFKLSHYSGLFKSLLCMMQCTSTQGGQIKEPELKSK